MENRDFVITFNAKPTTDKTISIMSQHKAERVLEKKMRMEEISIEVQVDIAKDVAIAKAIVFDVNFAERGYWLTTVGTARKHPEDKFDPDVAMYLAAGRALDSMSKKMLKRGNGLVKQHEDVQIDHARRAAEGNEPFAKKKRSHKKRKLI